MMVVLSLVMLISPVLMGDSQSFENSLENYEEGNSADEH
jgi:hypothetical protein